jgi:hypothetical protein
VRGPVVAALVAILLTLLAGCSQAGSSQSGRSSAPVASSTEAPGGVPSTTDPRLTTGPGVWVTVYMSLLTIRRWRRPTLATGR